MAQLHQVSVDWTAESDEIFIGAEPRTILQLIGRKDAEVLSIHADVLGSEPGMRVEFLLVQQPVAHGVRRAKIEGRARVHGRQDFALSAWPEDALYYNALVHPEDFWQWCGRLDVPNGYALAVVARANRPCRCKVKMGGR